MEGNLGIVMVSDSCHSSFQRARKVREVASSTQTHKPTSQTNRVHFSDIQ